VVKDNKRVNARKYLIADIKIKKAGSRAAGSAVAVNISKEGVGLYTARPLERKDKVLIKLTVLLNGAWTASEEIPGTVRWIKPVGKNYCAGIKFDAIVSKKEYPVITRCISYALGRK
jgi:PilZ domain-containing protein